MRRVSMTAMGIWGAVAVLSLVASPVLAVGERSDIIKTNGETFHRVTTDSDGNFVTDQAYSVYSYSSYNYGSIYRLVETPSGNVSVEAWFEVDEPDFVNKPDSSSGVMKQTDQLYIESVTLFSPVSCGTGCSNSANDINLEGCKGKIKLSGPSGPHDPSDDDTASGAKTVLNCNQGALNAIFPNATVRQSVQSLLGTRDDGTGLKWKGTGLIDTDI